MTQQETINSDVRTKLEVHDAKFVAIMDELKQQREDIRRAQAEMKALQENQDAKMHEMNQRFYDKIDSNYKELTQQLHTNFVQTMLGVGAIMAAVGGLIIATLK